MRKRKGCQRNHWTDCFNCPYAECIAGTAQRPMPGEFELANFRVDGDKVIIQSTLEGEDVGEFKNIKDVLKVNEWKSATGIRECCKGERLASHGYKWRYEIIKRDEEG